MNKQRRRTEQQRRNENLMGRTQSRTDDVGPNLAEDQQAGCISRDTRVVNELSRRARTHFDLSAMETQEPCGP